VILRFLKKHRISPNFWATIFHGYGCVLIEKMGWATFWANFEQEHLVSLFCFCLEPEMNDMK
jgi:hypothetical protein